MRRIHSFILTAWLVLVLHATANADNFVQKLWVQWSPGGKARGDKIVVVDVVKATTKSKEDRWIIVNDMAEIVNKKPPAKPLNIDRTLYAEKQINALPEGSSDDQLKHSFVEALTKPTDDNTPPLIRRPNLGLWNVEVFRGSDHLVVAAKEKKPFPHVLVFRSYAAFARIIEPLMEKCTVSLEAAYKEENYKEVLCIGESPWERLRNGEGGTDWKEFVENDTISPKVALIAAATKDRGVWLLVNRDEPFPLALPPPAKDHRQLVIDAFSRGEVKEQADKVEARRLPDSPTSIDDELFEELLSNALFPAKLYRRGAKIGANSPYWKCDFLNLSEPYPGVLLGLPVQWDSDAVPSAARPAFYWRLSNRYQARMLGEPMLKDDPNISASDMKEKWCERTFGRDDETIHVPRDSPLVVFHPESTPAGADRLLPRGLHLWPPKLGTYQTEGADAYADNGLRFSLVRDLQPSFYIQDREFTWRHLDNVCGIESEFNNSEQRDYEKLFYPTGDTGRSANKAQSGAGEPSKDPSASPSAAALNGIAKPAWEELNALTSWVAKQKFGGENELLAASEPRMAGRAFKARLNSWSDRLKEGLEEGSWLDRRCRFEFACLLARFEERAISWLALREALLSNPVDAAALAEKAKELLANEERRRHALSRYAALRGPLKPGPNRTENNLVRTTSPLDWPITGISHDEFERMVQLDDQVSITQWPVEVSLPTVHQWNAAAVDGRPRGAWTDKKAHHWPVRSLVSTASYSDGVDLDPPLYNLHGNVSEFVTCDKMLAVVGGNYREKLDEPIEAKDHASSPAVGFRLVLIAKPPSNPDPKPSEPKDVGNPNGASAPKANEALEEARPVSEIKPKQDCTAIESATSFVAVEPPHWKLSQPTVFNGAYPWFFGWRTLPKADRTAPPKPDVKSLLWQEEQHSVHTHLGAHRFWHIEHLRNVLWGAWGDETYARDQLAELRFLQNVSAVLQSNSKSRNGVE